VSVYQDAIRKALLLRRLLQGKMGLESQALSEEFLDVIERETVSRLLHESNP
jgi:hypothetical protein